MAWLMLVSPCFAAALTDSQRACLTKAWRHERDGWIHLHVEGPPRERGFQHGYLLAKEIGECLRVRRRLWEYQSGMEWDWLVERSARMMNPRIDAENLDEIDGIVEGLAAADARGSRDELVAFNAFFELAWYWWPKEKKKLSEDAASPGKQSCSSFIATGSFTADGGVVLGHNTMFDYPMADANVILDLVPAAGHRILMQTFPGWIHSGTDFFVTSAGLVGSETTIGDFDGFDEKGVPEFVRMRRATQDAGSIDEWCAIMKQGNNGGYANAWLIGDVNTREIARLELGLKHIGFERTSDGCFYGSNVAENLKVLRLETTRNEVDIRSSAVARRVRWKKLMAEHKGRIDLELGKQFEADHFDTCLDKVNPGARSLCGHFELDPQLSGKGIPFDPSGTFDAKVVDARLAKQMAFAARWGAACGLPFNAEEFLARHPQFDWMSGILKSRPSQSWTIFRAGEKP
jgi:Phospholipase B